MKRPRLSPDFSNEMPLVAGTSPQAQAFDARYDDLIAQLQHERAKQEKLSLAYQRAREDRLKIKAEIAQVLAQGRSLAQQIQELHTKVTIKQRVIALLLPYYPHPMTPELRWQLDC